MGYLESEITSEQVLCGSDCSQCNSESQPISLPSSKSLLSVAGTFVKEAPKEAKGAQQNQSSSQLVICERTNQEILEQAVANAFDILSQQESIMVNSLSKKRRKLNASKQTHNQSGLNQQSMINLSELRKSVNRSCYVKPSNLQDKENIQERSLIEESRQHSSSKKRPFEDITLDDLVKNSK